jgi:hypothetical protein
MTFLQPALLWGLAAVSLPILIHFLNRLRYRSVKWGAMMFLIKAARSSTRHARLRQYLILLFRSLLVMFLALALARPIIGGWLGMRIAGDPDTIIVLLDRSVSMEDSDPRRQSSKREHALRLLSQVATQTSGSSRYVLIESALRSPHEIADPSVLPELALTGPTDTTADLPAMFRSALDYIVRNRTGRTEIWVASDMRVNDWQPDSPEWKRLGTQLAALPQDVRVRLLALTDPVRRNVSVAVRSVFRRKGDETPELDIGIDFASSGATTGSFPVTVILGDTRTQFDVDLESQSLSLNHRVPLPTGQTSGGWGVIELPADGNNRDNLCYFLYGADIKQVSGVVAESREAGQYFGPAAAPAPESLNQACNVVPPIDAAQMAWDELSLVVWQARAPDEDLAQTVEQFVADGGVLLCVPPGSDGVPGPMGLEWGKVETGSEEEPFRLSSWEENDGPLARTVDGANLPVALVECRRRQLCRAVDEVAESGVTSATPGIPKGWYAVARYADGRPFLMRRRVGRGMVYVCTSLPGDAWSNLGNGIVLVPMLQRMLRKGGHRLQGIAVSACGEWRPEDVDDTWVSLQTGERRDHRWQAGLYRSGERRLALNRPSGEQLPDTMDAQRPVDLLGDLPVQVLTGPSGPRTGGLQTEIWRGFLYAVLLCAVVESWLALGEQRRAAAREGRAA